MLVSLLEMDGEKPDERAPDLVLDDKTSRGFVSWYRTLPKVRTGRQ